MRSSPTHQGRSVDLTASQRAIFVSHTAFPSTGHQNPAILIRIESGVDLAKLKGAFEAVVLKVDVLRLRFPELQTHAGIVCDQIPDPTKVVETAEAKFLDWCRQRAKQPLDLTISCYESVMCQHPDGAVTWYLNLHHIINDGSSVALVLDAVNSEYEGLEVAPQDFFGADAAHVPIEIEDYWAARSKSQQIDRLYAHLTRSSSAAEHARIEFDANLETAWQSAFSGPYHIFFPGIAQTAFLLAVTGHYLFRLSGRSSFSIGVVINLRGHTGAQDLIGPVFDVFPVRITVDPNDTHLSLFTRTSETLFEVLKHARCGVAPAQDFDAVVNVLPATVSRTTFAGLSCRMSWLDAGSIDGTHALRVIASPYAECSDEMERPSSVPDIRLDYNATALGDVPGEEARSHMQNLISAALAHPGDRLDKMALGNRVEAEPSQGVGSSKTLLSEMLVQDRLRQVLEGNMTPVLSENGEVLTGDDLWQWATEIATFLASEMNAQDPVLRVGIELAPSIEAVAAIYGAVLAGVSFVPLDKKQPTSRLDELKRRAGLGYIFETAKQVRELRPAGASKAKFGETRISPETEAYLLFTSGSTGTPKGVPISFAGLSRYLAHATEAYFDGTGPVVAPLFGALTFDLGITALFGVPLAGGRLEAFPDPAARAIGRIATTPDVNWIKATPSQLDILVKQGNYQCKFDTVIVGGETFTSRLAREILRKNPDAKLINEYGPTEAVVGCMQHAVTADDLSSSSDIPIGHPIDGVSLRVMDKFGQPVPKGVIGELWISHNGITKCYLDGDRDPFGVHEDQRFYKSGDLVRLGMDHLYQFIGRADLQMKLSGVRIDPSEIEAAAIGHAGVESAVARIWSPSNKRVGLRCKVCGLPDSVPGVRYTDAGICSSCIAYDEVKETAQTWFGSECDLDELLTEKREETSSKYDCMHLLSGGKDSTFALYKLVQLGATPYVLTLDNGYISEEAKENIDRVIADLGLTHEYARPQGMNDIFRESLQKFSNVCNGCYKSLYVMATARADALGIRVVITGLSRGQLFETRLVPEQFKARKSDFEAIDQAVLSARKAYHGVQDACSGLPEATVFSDEAIFERVTYVDFYRYVDVSLTDMLEFLSESTPWRRPSDTGRSTNCLINDVGIFTHLAERGYHNYAIPYAWDVRLGHKSRDEAVAELDDDLNHAQIQTSLDDIGYEISPRHYLALWFTGGDVTPSSTELQAYLAARLPYYAVPQGFLEIDEIPLSENGKVDVAALPQPARALHPRTDFSAIDVDPLEAQIIAIWEKQLKLAPIGLNDDFFLLGGDSLSALGMIVSLAEELGLPLNDGLPFSKRTPMQLANAVREIRAKNSTSSGVFAHKPSPDVWDAQTPPPLTAGEAGLLFEEKLDTGSTSLNAARVFWVEAQVSVEKLHAAILQASTLHVPLTWSFGSPRQHIEPQNVVDFDVLPVAQDRAFARDQMKDVIAERFDLNAGPLVRARLQKLEDGTNAVLIVMHHVSCDHESFTVLWEQISQIYGGSGPNPCPEIDYPTFVKSLQENSEEDAQKFWRNRAFKASGTLLGTLAPVQASRDGLISKTLPISADDLKRGHKTPLAARATLAADCAFRPFVAGGAVTVGLLTTSRNRPGAKHLVGYLLNALPLQLDHSSESFTEDVLEDTTEQVADVLQYPHLQYGEILAARRTAGKALPKVHVFVSLVDDPPLFTGPLRATHEALHDEKSVADATLFVELGPEDAHVKLEYRRTILSDAAALDILSAFASSLVALQSSKSIPVGELANYSKSIAVGPPLPVGPLLPLEIEHHLRHSSGAPALVFNGVTYSYSELASRIAQIGRALEAEGVTAGDLVAIALPRGVNYVAAILAVHRLRAAYLPLDVSNSEERQRNVLAAANPTCVLHGGVFSRALPDVLVSDQGIGTEPWQPTSLPGVPATKPDDIAYTIFTSGTTAQPKGVAITQAQLAASIHGREAMYDNAPKRFVMPSSFAFDSSMVGLFWTLSKGGTLVLPTEEQAHAPEALTGLLADEKATHVLMVPTLYSVLLDQKQRASSFHWPDHVILAGEAFPINLVRKHFAACSGQSRLTNEYGPTEATICALVQPLGEDVTGVAAGRPMPGGWVAIVGPDNSVCPEGAIGEIVIGGPQVADGYISAQSSDQLRFERSELPDHRGQRSYRTGDQAYMREGVVHYIGRLDNQLNLGGLRVEAAEIEELLVSIPGVSAAVAIATDSRSLTHLIERAGAIDLQNAFAESANDGDPEMRLQELLRRAIPAAPELVMHLQCNPLVPETLLREHINTLLPVLLRPSRIIQHDVLPVTPNGKIDRQSLVGVSESIQHQTAPEDTRESVSGPFGDADVSRLCKLFAHELRNDGVLPDDNFFEFGGNSLSALHLVLQVEKSFGVSLSTSDLYIAPTPYLLLDKIFSGQREVQPATHEPEETPDLTSKVGLVFPLQLKGSKPPIVALHNVGENGVAFQALSRALGPDQPFWCVSVEIAPSMYSKAVDPSSPRRVEDVARIYVKEIERLFPTGPLILAGTCLGVIYTYEVAQQLAAKGRPPLLVYMDNDTHAPERGFESTSISQYLFRAQVARLKKRGLKGVAKAIPLVPTVTMLWSKRVYGELLRKYEIRALVRTKAKGRQLSHRLVVRDFIESSYRSVHEYDFRPYSWPVVITRNADEFYPDPESNNAWGTRLSDVEITWLRPHAQSVDDLHKLKAVTIQTRLDRFFEHSAQSFEPVQTANDLHSKRGESNFSRGSNRYRVSVKLQDDRFIASPRIEQKQWLVGGRLQELAGELEHLDRIAPEMISANGQLVIDGRDTSMLAPHEIMEDWQIPLMKEMVKISANKGDDVLEVGYGRGISSRMIQAASPRSHTIIECNPSIVADAKSWAALDPTQDIRVIQGYWQDVVEGLGQFDGILFHTYPLDTDELAETLAKYSTFAESFFPYAARLLRPGGRFTYFTNEVDSISRAHQRALLEHFASYKVGQLHNLNIPETSADAHWFNSIVTIEAIA